MRPTTLRLRQRLGALLLAPILGSAGCQVQNHEQQLACYEPGKGQDCAALPEASEKLDPSPDSDCKTSNDLLSVDEGPVEVRSETSDARSCCYLATYDTLTDYHLCLGSGRPLLGPDGPRVARLRREHGWG